MESPGRLHRDRVVIGASAGGLEALLEILRDLPPALDAAIFVVVHLPPAGGSALQRILSRETSLAISVASDGQEITNGHIYICPGDHHLLVDRRSTLLRRGPREHGHRPAVDPLFRSAASYFGPRVVGVILSGNLSDGTSGLFTIKSRGGVAIVQSPGDALYAGMPESAIRYVDVDHVAPADELGHIIAREVAEPIPERSGTPEPRLLKEVALMERDDRIIQDDHPGHPSPWPCPDCHGVLWEIRDGPITRFRCRVGHAWSEESLLQEQGRGVEAALWMALRALEDRAALTNKMVSRAEDAGRTWGANRHRDDLAAMTHSIDTLRNILSRDDVSDAFFDSGIPLGSDARA